MVEMFQAAFHGPAEDLAKLSSDWAPTTAQTTESRNPFPPLHRPGSNAQMKLSKITFAAAAGWFLCMGSSAIGQDTVQMAPDLRLTLRPAPEASIQNQDEQAQPSPSDIVPAPPATAPEPTPDDKADDKVDFGKSDGWVGYCREPMCAGDPWELFPARCSGLNAGGWFQVGYTTEGTNGDGTGMFNDYPNTVQLNQAWFFLEKAVDNGGCGFDWGFRADYIYGTDGPDTQAFGGPDANWDNPWDAGGYYGHAIPQLYAEVAYNKLSAKIGHFYTICGYEVVQATGNFFYSHAFTMYNAEPFTHTGILAQYDMSDRLTLWGGWTQGWDTGFWNNGGDTFLGGFSVGLTDNVTATYTTTMGDFGFGGTDSTGYSQSIVVDVQLTDRLNYVFLSDYVDNDLFANGARDPLDKRWSIVNYLFYDITECVAAGVRYEYYEEEGGADAILAPGMMGGNHVNAVTVGLNVKPHANVIIRPEVRFEEFDPAADRDDQTLFAVDAIFTF
jgi:hypothetical protein